MYNSNLYKLLFLLQLFCFSANAFAEEKITSYNVFIKVLADSSLEIREQIDFIAEGDKIKRGLYRDFPTKYRDSHGFKKNVSFDIKSVTRDGHVEDYHTERLSNGTRIYLGKANRFLDHGKHSYNFSFKTNRQLGFFEKHDELYFNAIGTGWNFKIERATVSVELPINVNKQDIQVDGFTGRQGSTKKAFKITSYTDNGVNFATTSSLDAFEGFTIVVGWPKGIVKKPTAAQNLVLFIQDSFLAVIAILLCLASVVTNLFLWLTHGVDPKKGTIYPRFAAPANFAPYDLPYIINMGYTPKCLSSAIVSCSIKGHALIREEAGILGLGETFHIDKTSTPKAELDNLERIIIDTLFHRRDSVRCTSTSHDIFEAAKNRLTNYCESKLGKYYQKNLGWTMPGIALNAVAFILSLLYQSSSLTTGIVTIAIASTITFFILIKRYSSEGRGILDEIEGYKMYLDTAEKGHYDNLQFPQLNQERFEAHLPYAVALGVEAKWMTAFRKAMTIANQTPDNYKPYYYMGDRSFTESSFMNRSSSAFSSTIASSSTPPGSSSGFSGGSGGSGGSSGGGGGGGGGGGW